MLDDFRLNLSPIFEKIREVFPDDQPIYLVGGAVRDAILGRVNNDLDFTLERDAIKTARRIANSLSQTKNKNISSRAGSGIIKVDFFPLDIERDTGRVIVTHKDGTHILMDFSSFRGSGSSAGAERSLETDIRGRDFTLNAIAINLSDNSIHDPLSGVMDLEGKLLRACSPSTFSDDPVRILRGVRLAANYGFSIIPETLEAMKAAVAILGTTSTERLRDELFRILDGLLPAACIRALDLLGVLDIILPELGSLKNVEQNVPHVHDVWEHTLRTMSFLESIFLTLEPDYDPEIAAELFNGMMVLRIGRYRKQISDTFTADLTADRSTRSLLFLAALLHDVAKPQTKIMDEAGQARFWEHDQLGAEMAVKQARELVMSNDEIKRLETVIRNHMRILFHSNRLETEGKLPSRRAIYRFFRDTGPAGVDICFLALADLRATYEQNLTSKTWTAILEVVRLMLENWFEKPAESIAPKVLVTGDDLMREFNLQPGETIGKLLENIRESQAMAEVSTREQALEFARRKLKENP